MLYAYRGLSGSIRSGDPEPTVLGGVVTFANSKLLLKGAIAVMLTNVFEAFGRAILLLATVNEPSPG